MIKNISHLAPFGLRIPEDLKADLDAASGKNLRSLNSEMIARLKDSFKRPLSEYSDAELVAELLSRHGRGEIYIRIGRDAGDAEAQKSE